MSLFMQNFISLTCSAHRLKCSLLNYAAFFPMCITKENKYWIESNIHVLQIYLHPFYRKIPSIMSRPMRMLPVTPTSSLTDFRRHFRTTLTMQNWASYLLDNWSYQLQQKYSTHLKMTSTVDRKDQENMLNRIKSFIQFGLIASLSCPYTLLNW